LRTLSATDEIVDERPRDRPGRRIARSGRRLQRKLVPYALAVPGGVWLLAFFLVPLGMTVYTSLKSGGLLLGGFHFTWHK
jgi:ABC-type sugar transport system permease subunit